MKLDLKKMASAIAANGSSGPGDPIEEINKKLAGQGLYFDKSSKTVKAIPGWTKMNYMQSQANDARYESTMNSQKDSNLTAEQLAKLPGFEKTYERFMRQAPETGEALKTLLVKEGIMGINPKSGDFFMTDKGMDMNRKGMLTKYKMNF